MFLLGPGLFYGGNGSFAVSSAPFPVRRVAVPGGVGSKRRVRGGGECWRPATTFPPVNSERGKKWNRRRTRMNADRSSMVSRKDAKIAKKNAELGPKMNENEIGRIIVDAAVALHRELGPGLLESVYEAVLARELADRGLKVDRQISIPITWRGMRFDEGFRADIIVGNSVILELKSVERTTHAHKKQVLTYLKLTGMGLGYLLNFGAAVMKEGITRIVNDLPE